MIHCEPHMNVHAIRTRQLVYQQIIKAWMMPFPIVSEVWPSISLFRGDLAKAAVWLLGSFPREKRRKALTDWMNVTVHPEVPQTLLKTFPHLILTVTAM